MLLALVLVLWQQCVPNRRAGTQQENQGGSRPLSSIPWGKAVFPGLVLATAGIVRSGME